MSVTHPGSLNGLVTQQNKNTLSRQCFVIDHIYRFQSGGVFCELFSICHSGVHTFNFFFYIRNKNITFFVVVFSLFFSVELRFV